MKLWPLEPTKSIDTKKYHQRVPDIGLRLRVTIPYEDGQRSRDYIGEYYGHGQSKTAFILNGAPGDPYDGKILKVTAKRDSELSVFTEMTERSPGTTLRILYQEFSACNFQPGARLKTSREFSAWKC